MAIPFSYSSRSLWARRATTAATAGGIALVVFVLSASQMLSAGMRSTLLRAGRDDKAIVMQRDAYAQIDSRLRQGVLTAASGAPGVRHAASGEPLVSAESLVQLFVPRLAIAQRRREIGVLRALGLSSGQVLLAFLLESTVLALAGATIGAGLACFLSLASFSATNYGTGNEITFPFQPTPLILLRSLLSGALVGVLGGFFPALQAARTSPVRALRA
ncbi:MAG TPA: ABC transporter permease [Polyangiaceae bacterium]|nr:ABC transporter permease [Polyangiaceae bacterium]